MKPLLIAIGGVGFALVMFLSGIVVATAFFKAEPERKLSLATDTSDIWTDQAVKVDPSKQDFDRLAARPVPQQTRSHSPAQPAAPAGFNTEVAAEEKAPSKVEANSQTQPDLQAETIAAHVEWCSERYRSYRAYDNSYTPYSGGRRECVSPYFGATDIVDASNDPEASYESEGQAELMYANDQDYVSTDHMEYCFSRYRSYRYEDNTYQPFDGGPRRQCR